MEAGTAVHASLAELNGSRHGVSRPSVTQTNAMEGRNAVGGKFLPNNVMNYQHQPESYRLRPPMDSEGIGGQNRSISLTDEADPMAVQRRMSIISTASRSSRYSFSSIRSHLTRTFSHESPKNLDETRASRDQMRKHSFLTLRKRSHKHLERQREYEEEQRKAKEAEALLALSRAEEVLKRESGRAATAEEQLKTTSSALQDLKLRLQEVEEELDKEKLGREDAEKRAKNAERNILDEKVAAEKVYKMYVDLAYEVASAKLELTVPNPA